MRSLFESPDRSPTGLFSAAPRFGQFDRRFGQPEYVRFWKIVGERWNKDHPETPIGFGDPSQRGGGVILNHRGNAHSKHQEGVSADVLIPGSTKSNVLKVGAKGYNPALVQEFVDFVGQTAADTGLVKIKDIFFDDRTIRGVHPVRGHEGTHLDHLHFEAEVVK